MIFVPSALLVAALAAPAALQSAMLQSPDVPGSPVKAVAADVRHFLRQTSPAGGPAAPQGMVLVPAGTVVMGIPVERVELLGQNDPTTMLDLLAETPRHSVPVDSFLIDVTEVTNLQWKVFLDATGRKPTPTLVDLNWPGGEIPKGLEQHPISNVNIPEIRDFLVWSGKRLPTEAEWVRAARGDDERDYPWGSKWDGRLCRSAMDGTPQATAVGSYSGGASPYGVFDMAGNVFEWVDSSFSAYAGFQPLTYKRNRKTQTLLPQFNSTKMVIKGGAYTNTRSFTRIDVRVGKDPVESDDALGFRAARSTRPGLDSIRHGLRRLQSPQLARTGIDEADIFGREDIAYDEKHRVITGFRFLGFAHRAPERGSPLSKLRGQSVDEPVPLGVLVTSEALAMRDMPVANGAAAGATTSHSTAAAAAKASAAAKPGASLPPGEYLLAFKGEGESKAFKEAKREERKSSRNGRKPGGAEPAEDEPAAETGAEASAGPAGAAAPWPGVVSVHDIEEDVDFPQKEDVILFYNANSVVVGWCKALPITETDITPIEEAGTEQNRIWDVKFSLNQVSSKRGPRFHLRFELLGEGF